MKGAWNVQRNAWQVLKSIVDGVNSGNLDLE